MLKLISILIWMSRMGKSTKKIKLINKVKKKVLNQNN